MAPLIGILGTIIGFYFGQAAVPGNPPGTAGQTQELRIADMASAPEQVTAAGGTVSVTGTVNRGSWTVHVYDYVPRVAATSNR